MKYYPVALDLKGRRVVVAGGGPVAARKVGSLLAAGARVCVVAPQAVGALRRWARDGRIAWRPRRIAPRDIRSAALVIAATDDQAVNAALSRWARREDRRINVVDQPRYSDFISPAVFRRRRSIVAVYTDGRDPVLSRDLKNYLREKWDDFLRYRDQS